MIKDLSNLFLASYIMWISVRKRYGLTQLSEDQVSFRLHVQTQANAWNNTTNDQRMRRADQKQVKSKNLYIIFLVVMSLFACTPLPSISLFVTTFGYPGDVIFEWPVRTLSNIFDKIINGFSR